MGKRRFNCLIVLAALFLPPLTASAQCCDDCNGNGVVTIDEILTGVNNALNGCSMVSTPIGGSTRTPTPAESPTALPDQCATDPPGTRLTVLGTDYVVVEVEVVLQNSADTYLLRYPAQLDARGQFFRSPVSNIYLKQVPCNTGSACKPLGSICGFSARFNDSTTSTSSYSDSPGTPTWTFSFSPFTAVSIILDDAHEPAYLYFVPQQVEMSVNVPALSSFGFSLADANYPEPPAAQIARLQAELASLFSHISLVRESLPTAPQFPRTPTPRPCLPSGANCDYGCFASGQPSCCPPFVCSVFGQCVTPKPTPTGPPATATPPCPR